MNQESLLSGLVKVEQFAAGSAVSRLLAAPGRYITGIGFRNLVYRLTHKGKLFKARTFWGAPFTVVLPAGMDIYLSGGKTHDSEVRLARFMIHELSEDDHVLDIGAHFGYFSLLAAACVGTTGRVVAIEASAETYKILTHNTLPYKQISAMHHAVSDENTTIEFLEFPVIYSEFNTLETDQYASEKWFQRVKPKRIKVHAVTAAELIETTDISPRIIKIDVEGAEAKAIDGLTRWLEENDTFVVMEFSQSARGNQNHILADGLLREIDYDPHYINKDGQLIRIEAETAHYVDQLPIESDNIIYCRKATI